MSGQWRESQLIVIFFKGMFYVSCSNIKIDIAPERQKESMTINSLPRLPMCRQLVRTRLKCLGRQRQLSKLSMERVPSTA